MRTVSHYPNVNTEEEIDEVAHISGHPLGNQGHWAEVRLICFHTQGQVVPLGSGGCKQRRGDRGVRLGFLHTGGELEFDLWQLWVSGGMWQGWW